MGKRSVKPAPGILGIVVLLVLLAVFLASGSGRFRFGDASAHYERAIALYKAGQDDAAVGEIRRGLHARLAIPGPEKRYDTAYVQAHPGEERSRLQTLRLLSDRNAAYAVLLGKQKQSTEAETVCSLNHAMAGQLIADSNGNMWAVLNAITVETAGDRARADALKAAGETADAEAAAARRDAIEKYDAGTIRPFAQAFSARMIRDPLIRQYVARTVTKFTPDQFADFTRKEREFTRDLADLWEKGPAYQ